VVHQALALALALAPVLVVGERALGLAVQARAQTAVGARVVVASVVGPGGREACRRNRP